MRWKEEEAAGDCKEGVEQVRPTNETKCREEGKGRTQTGGRGRRQETIPSSLVLP